MEATVTIAIPSRDTHPVVADWYGPSLLGGSIDHVVVMCHGFKGHRRWGFIPIVAGRLAAAGFGVLVMDFSHNGHVPEDPEAFADEEPGRFVATELFRANTIARELDDLAAVVAWVRAGRSAKVMRIAENATIGLWGHSRGGVVAILTALADPGVAALVTWSALAHPDHFTPRQKEIWRTAGELAFTDYPSGTALSLGIGLLDDLDANRAAYDVGTRAGDLTAPHLIIHGEHDPTVPVEQSYLFYDTPTIRADKKLLRLLTGHTYGYDDGRIASEALENATKATVEWFETYLRGTRTPPR